MHNRRIIALTISVSVIGILLSSCYKTFKCPPYPEDMAKFMPTQYSGGILRYLIGNDTCALEVGKLSLSKAYKDKSDCGFDHCEATATQLLGKMGAYSIDYIQTCGRNTELVKLAVLIGGHEYRKDIGIWWVSYDFEDKEHAQQHDYEILPEYVAPTGKIYSRVLFYHYQDSVWISYNEGLVRYVPSQADTTALGQVWQLL